MSSFSEKRAWPPQIHQAGEWSVRQVFEATVRRDLLSPDELRASLIHLSHWERRTANPPCQWITDDVAQSYVNALVKEGFTPASIKTMWGVVLRIVGPLFETCHHAMGEPLAILPGRAPRVKIRDAARHPAKYLRFDPLSLTLRDAFERYYLPDLQVDRSKRTIAEYEITLGQWERHTADPEVRAINNETVTQFKLALANKGLSPATVNKRLRHVRAVLRRLSGQWDRNPGGLGFLPRTPYTRFLKEPAKLPRTLTTGQLAKLYAACEGATWPAEQKTGITPRNFWRAIVVTAYNTGLSKEDLFGLKHEAVDFERGLITVVRGKTGRVVRIPLNEALCRALTSIWRPAQRDELFYVTQSNRQLYGQWHAIQKAAGIDPDPVQGYFGFHDLRRTCATELERLAAGAGTFVLGHSNPSVTWKFYRNPSVATRAAIENLPQFDEPAEGATLALAGPE